MYLFFRLWGNTMAGPFSIKLAQLESLRHCNLNEPCVVWLYADNDLRVSKSFQMIRIHLMTLRMCRNTTNDLKPGYETIVK